MLKTRHLLLFACLLMCVSNSRAQKYDFVWYFGADKVGIDFNYSVGGNCYPRVMTNGATNHFWEGAVSISDPNTGSLMFYSDGIRVYNANHAIMPHGAAVTFWNSVAQNIIIPKPGSQTIYYLVCPEVQAARGSIYLKHPGMNYAVIDMSLDGGLGDVVSNYTELIDSGNCEMLTAVPSPDRKIIWLIGHQYANNSFFVFKIDSNGIPPTPTFYNVGPVIFTPQMRTPHVSAFDAIGSIKPSLDGSKLAMTTFYNAFTTLFDFDNTTGVISNPLRLDINQGTGSFGGYGISFSPDNSKLYFTGVDTAIIMYKKRDGKVYQYDLSSGDSNIIRNSRTLLYNCADCCYGTAKLAPDGKIYISHYGAVHPAGDPYLDVIENPDSAGLKCNYVHDGLWLNGQRGSWGLNNSIEWNVSCEPSVALAAEEVNAIAEFTVYPVPASRQLNISLPATGQVSIFNVMGQQVYTQGMQKGIRVVDVSGYAEGVYMLTLKTGITLQTRKFVVQR